MHIIIFNLIVLLSIQKLYSLFYVSKLFSIFAFLKVLLFTINADEQSFYAFKQVRVFSLSLNIISFEFEFSNFSQKMILYLCFQQLSYKLKNHLKKMEKIIGSSILSTQQAANLLKSHSSPLFVYDSQIVRNKAKALTKAAEGFHISYAIKANNNSQILKILQEQGIKNVDVVSPGEMYKALKLGYKPNEILYTQNFISQEEIDYAMRQGVILNIGALHTLKTFASKLANKQIFVRINPQLGAGQTYQVVTGGPRSKFGIYWNQIDELLKIAQQNKIHIVGLHQHIGSNLKSKDQDVFIKTVEYIFQMSKRFPELKYLNIGGGIGIQYKSSQILMNIEEFYDRVRKIRDSSNQQTGRNIQVWIEPGRFLVGDCGILLSKLTAKKKTPQRTFYGVDTGFNHLLRPALYGSHHEIYNISNPDCPKQLVTVCGNICECSDNLGQNIQLGGEVGDIICIQNAGAYAYSMSSNYNERLKPAQILKEGQQFRVIRRRQTYEDLMEKV